MDFIQNVLACFSRKMEEINEKIVEIYKEKEKIK